MAIGKQLTKNFHTREFRSSDGASLPPAHVAQLHVLAKRYLQPLRDEFGPTTVHSGHRSRKLNDQVGGADESYHMRLAGRPGAAADVSCERGTPRDWYEFLDRLGAPGLGLYDTHVHVDNRAGRARW